MFKVLRLELFFFLLYSKIVGKINCNELGFPAFSSFSCFGVVIRAPLLIISAFDLFSFMVPLMVGSRDILDAHVDSGSIFLGNA